MLLWREEGIRMFAQVSVQTVGTGRSPRLGAAQKLFGLVLTHEPISSPPNELDQSRSSLWQFVGPAARTSATMCHFCLGRRMTVRCGVIGVDTAWPAVLRTCSLTTIG